MTWTFPLWKMRSSQVKHCACLSALSFGRTESRRNSLCHSKGLSQPLPCLEVRTLRTLAAEEGSASCGWEVPRSAVKFITDGTIWVTLPINVWYQESCWVSLIQNVCGQKDFRFRSFSGLGISVKLSLEHPWSTNFKSEMPWELLERGCSAYNPLQSRSLQWGESSCG